MRASLLSAAIAITVASNAAGDEHPLDLTQMPLESLMMMEVTSVAKKPQKLYESAAAVHVISQQDIRRSGMTSLPDLLRLAPGVNVAQINASQWALSIRGFNGLLANKLLVLIDGRSVYSPTFAGVNWDVQDTLIEDIERIEVIRGPGGTVWGANAMNGVINIITKHAQDTQGNLLVAGGGTQDNNVVSYRYGGSWGEQGHYRVFVKHFDRDAFERTDGSDAKDGWQAVRGGFRADWNHGSADAFTLQGDIYDSQAAQLASSTDLTAGTVLTEDRRRSQGGNLLFRWTRQLSEQSEWSLQSYFDRAERDDINLEERVDTYDLELQHRFPWGQQQEITWGLGYRRVADQFTNSFTLSFDPSRRDSDLFSAFLQDEVALHPDLRLILGSKLEHHDASGYEFQPSARLLWLATPQLSLWGAVSRAVRTPSRSHQDLRINVTAIPGAMPSVIAIIASDAVKSEQLVAYELGLRQQLSSRLSLDAAAFYNVYDDLLSVEAATPFVESESMTDYEVSPQYLDNLMEGEQYGIELSANWQASPHWRLTAGYSLLQSHLHLKAGGSDMSREQEKEGSTPEQQLQLHSHLDLSENLELDTALYLTDQLPSLQIAGYARLDMSLKWYPITGLQLSLTGLNLLDQRHPEFNSAETSSSEIPRSLNANLAWRW